jgi:hypothetical protein
MDSLREENFFVEIDEEMFRFYREKEEVYLVKYKENEAVEEKSIINQCRHLNSVILSTDRKISVIVTSKEGELILYTMSRDEIVDKVTLLRASFNSKYIQIASVNDSLNIFYISENNNVSTLCFRILNSKLILSPPLVLENLNIISKIPFIVSVDNNKLRLCYVKTGYPSFIGYRSFDFKKTSWSNFNTIDSSYYPIQDYSFATSKETVAYSFTFVKQQKPYVRFGFGADEIKRDMIDEFGDSIDISNVALTSENNLCITYIVDNTLKLKEMKLNGSTKTTEEIYLSKVREGNKYSFQSNNNIYTNFIIKVTCEDKIVYTDSYFYDKHLNRNGEEIMKVNSFPDKNLILGGTENSYRLLTQDMNSNLTQEGMLQELNVKLKRYEEKLKLISKNSMKWDDEKNKLRLNITSLHEEINKKYTRINTLEKALTEKQNLILSYEAKLKELMDSMKELQSKGYELEKKQEEILKLKELIAESNSEKTNYLNESKELKNEVNSLSNIIKNKTEEVTILKNQIAVLEEKNKESFIRKLFKSGD